MWRPPGSQNVGASGHSKCGYLGAFEMVGLYDIRNVGLQNIQNVEASGAFKTLGFRGIQHVESSMHFEHEGHYQKQFQSKTTKPIIIINIIIICHSNYGHSYTFRGFRAADS